MARSNWHVSHVVSKLFFGKIIEKSMVNDVTACQRDRKSENQRTRRDTHIVAFHRWCSAALTKFLQNAEFGLLRPRHAIAYSTAPCKIIQNYRVRFCSFTLTGLAVANQAHTTHQSSAHIVAIVCRYVRNSHGHHASTNFIFMTWTLFYSIVPHLMMYTDSLPQTFIGTSGNYLSSRQRLASLL